MGSGYGAGKGLIDRLRRLLGSRHALRWTVVLAAVLVMPALATGRALDDHAHQMMLRQAPLLERGPTELYSFLPDNAELRAAMRKRGVIPWYTDPEMRAEFWRPIASLALWADYQIAPDSPWVAHAHSVLWYGALVLLVGLVYRRLFTPIWAGALATLLFAVDDAHGLTVAWTANRHAVIGMVFGALALLAHVRWRQDGCRWSAALAPVALAAGLLASETAASITAYLFAFAWVLDRGTLRTRLLALVPCAAVCVVWRVRYRGLGYGIRATDLYTDPVDEPVRFVAAAVERWPALLHAQLGGLPADPFLFYPPVLAALAAAVAVGVLLIMLMIAARFIQHDRQMRCWLVGLVLSALPLCTAFPHDRMLLPLGIGGAGLVARFLSHWVEPGLGETTYWKQRTVRGLAWFWVGVHLVLAPLLLPLRAYSLRWMGAPFEAAARSLDRAEPLAGKTLVFVTGPDFFFTSWAPLIRRSLGMSVPDQIRVLATTQGRVTVTREDAHTLRLRAASGMLTAPLDGMLRTRARLLRVGERFALGDWELAVTAVAESGRPTEVVTRFSQPLEHASLTWVSWTPDGYRRFALPAVGQTTQADGHALVDLLTARYP